jgi:hypothetical protein
MREGGEEVGEKEWYRKVEGERVVKILGTAFGREKKRTKFPHLFFFFLSPFPNDHPPVLSYSVSFLEKIAFRFQNNSNHFSFSILCFLSSSVFNYRFFFVKKIQLNSQY